MFTPRRLGDYWTLRPSRVQGWPGGERRLEVAERSPGFGPGRLELEQLDGLADSTTNLIGKTGMYEMTGTIIRTEFLGNLIVFRLCIHIKPSQESVKSHNGKTRRVASLVTYCNCVNSTTRQNSPIWDPPLYIAVIHFNTITIQLKTYFFKIKCYPTFWKSTIPENLPYLHSHIDTGVPSIFNRPGVARAVLQTPS